MRFNEHPRYASRADHCPRCNFERGTAENVSTNPKALEKIISPYTGKLMPLDKVPDDVFSRKLVGDGVAVELEEGEITAPIDSKILSVFPTKHAISLLDKSGNEILLHLGLDTVNLSGEGFEIFVKEGDEVKQGQLIAKVDLEVYWRSGRIDFGSGGGGELL